MKTYYTLNGINIVIGTRIPTPVGEGDVVELYDGTHVRVDTGEEKKWFAVSELNIVVAEAPGRWHISYLTGRPTVVGERFNNETVTRVGETLRVEDRYGCSVSPYWITTIPNTDGSTVPPTLPDHRMHDGVPQVKINRRWIPLADAGYCGRFYNKLTHVVYGGEVVAIADCRSISGVYIPKDKLCKIDGVYRLKSNCWEIDSVWHLRSSLHMIMDHNGNAVDFRLDEPDDSIYSYIQSREGYAAAEDCFECEGNGDEYLRIDGEDFDDGWYSNEWLNNNTSRCCECGRRVRDEDMCGDYCESCDEDRENSDGVRDYSDRSADRMKPERDIDLKFGIELEVEAKRGRADSISAFGFPDKYCVYKEDGSLGCGGFEIVTRPDCPSVHKRIFNEILAKPAVRDTTNSWKSGRCGIHIHVSRAPLGKLWLGRILVLVNSVSMSTIVRTVAGRYNETYSNVSAKQLTDGGRNGRNRYDAVNTSGDKTIEFRIFRGTLNRESFLKNVEFVEAVLAYCKPCVCGNRKAADAGAFCEFVRRHRKAYPFLFRFMLNKNLLTKTAKDLRDESRLQTAVELVEA